MKNLLLLLIIPFLSFGQDCVDQPLDDLFLIPDDFNCQAIVIDYGFDCNVFNSFWIDSLELFPAWTLSLEMTLEQTCCESCQGISIIENPMNKNLITKVDILGRETTNNKGFQLHIYDDGSIEKKYLIK